MLGQVTPQANLYRIEEEVRRFWRRNRVPEDARSARRDGSPYVIYQQPLAAAGQPPADQIRLLATADLFARYHAMQGNAVHHQMGWACHGLTVELAVEPHFADGDLARFNAACRDVAIEGLHQGQALAEWFGVWSDPDAAYASSMPQEIGLVWNALCRLWKAGRLKHEHRVASICPRCATPLSATEAVLRATRVKRQSIWLRLPWTDEPDTYFLAWMPTPWTLVGMVALAVHPDAVYVLVETGGMRLVLAEAALNRSLTDDYRFVRRVTGRALRGARYRPPFTFLPVGNQGDRIVVSQHVTLDQGTGLLPVTPASEAVSLTLAQSQGLPIPEPLDQWGSLRDAVVPWRGLSPWDTEPLIVDDLRTRGLVLREETRTQQCALCPYCETPLLPQARKVWFVETGSGPWIVNRDRAWGTPLPLWSCKGCGEQVCLAGLEELARRTGLRVEQIDPHRPALDRLTFACETCGGTMQRVAAVVDAAFDAAVLPWAKGPQLGPADLAVGLGDRDLGWLGDLTEIAALLRGSLAWEQAVALPEQGADATWDLVRGTPAAALRWASYTATTPQRAERDFLRSLLQLVADLDRAQAHRTSPEPGTEQGFLDRWLRARLHQAIGRITETLDAGDPHKAAAEVVALVDDISNCYIPHRSGGGGEILNTLSQLLAPFLPHLAEMIHRQATGSRTGSVHLSTWPAFDPAPADQSLLATMNLIWQLAALGHTARTQAGIEPDRRLRRAYVSLLSATAAEAAAVLPFRRLLSEVLDVEETEFTPHAATQVYWQLTLDRDQQRGRRVTPEEIETAFASLERKAAAHLVSQLWNGLSVSLQVGGQTIILLPDEASISVQVGAGWAAAAEDGHLVVLQVQ
ncbi:MAG: class I tRNA ligase family protein [Anaerolineae bacterium]